MTLSSLVCVYKQEEPFKSQHFSYCLTSAVEHLANHLTSVSVSVTEHTRRLFVHVVALA